MMGLQLAGQLSAMPLNKIFERPWGSPPFLHRCLRHLAAHVA